MKRENLKRLIVEALKTCRPGQEITSIRIYGAIIYCRTDEGKRITLMLNKCSEDRFKTPLQLISEDFIGDARAVKANAILQVCETSCFARILPLPEAAPGCVKIEDECGSWFFLYTR